MSDNIISTWLDKHPEVESIYACVCDLNGTLRGKRLPAGNAADKIADGNMRMPMSVVCVDVWGEDILNSALVFDTGDVDGRCELIGRPPVPISWTSQPAALSMLWMRREDGSPFDGDPRYALANILQRFRDHGLQPVVATELEFYLCEAGGNQPRSPRSPVSGQRLEGVGIMSVDDLQHFDDFLNDVYDACAVQGIPADASISENGAGQFEINMRHTADPLRAADDAVLFKRLVRGIARKHGFVATFMARPYADRSGSGFHVHFSLNNDEGVNVFDNGGEEGTGLLLNAVAGLLATMQQNTLVFAPHENSYRRLVAGSHAPTNITWGYENRTAAVRIPGGSPNARRIEHRVAGADANPYLVIAAILGGALVGIEQNLTAPDATTGNAYQRDTARMPANWENAIEAFAQGDQVQNIFSEQLQTMLVECKLQELKRFSQQISDFEYRTYLEVV